MSESVEKSEPGLASPVTTRRRWKMSRFAGPDPGASAGPAVLMNAISFPAVRDNAPARLKCRLEPLLRKKGWWGKQTVVGPDGRPRIVKLGSPRRLKTIFRTNLRVSASAARWERIQDRKDRFPYLMYDAVNDSRTRPQHLEWDGLVLPVDHPFWKTHGPPNGWGCRCILRQLSEAVIAAFRDILGTVRGGPQLAPNSLWDIPEQPSSGHTWPEVVRGGRKRPGEATGGQGAFLGERLRRRLPSGCSGYARGCPRTC